MAVHEITQSSQPIKIEKNTWYKDKESVLTSQTSGGGFTTVIDEDHEGIWEHNKCYCKLLWSERIASFLPAI